MGPIAAVTGDHWFLEMLTPYSQTYQQWGIIVTGNSGQAPQQCMRDAWQVLRQLPVPLQG